MKSKILLLPILLLSLILNGCFSINEDFEDIRDLVILSSGNDYKSEFQLSVGSVGITVSIWVIDASSDDDTALEILDDVSSVQVGVYKKLKGTNLNDFTILNDIEPEMQASGWRSIIRSSNDNELTAVYVRKEKVELLDRIFVISLENDELVLVEVEGDLREAMTNVIREKGMNVDI